MKKIVILASGEGMSKIQNLEKFYEEVGENIRRNRSKLRYSQDDLAKYLGLTRTSIVNIEKGRQRPTIHTLFEISGFLKISLADLLPKDDEKEKIDLRKSLSENYNTVRKKFKEVPIKEETLSHFFQVSSNK